MSDIHDIPKIFPGLCSGRLPRRALLSARAKLSLFQCIHRAPMIRLPHLINLKSGSPAAALKRFLAPAGFHNNNEELSGSPRFSDS